MTTRRAGGPAAVLASPATCAAAWSWLAGIVPGRWPQPGPGPGPRRRGPGSAPGPDRAPGGGPDCAEPAGAGPGATLRLAGEGLRFEAGVARGTVALATGLALAGAELVARRSGTPLEVDEAAVVAAVYLPLVLGTDAAAPPAPRPAGPGGGALCADLGAEGDREAFDRLLGTLEGDLPAEELAVRAQEWRLPVTPYRRMPSEPVDSTGGPGHGAAITPLDGGAHLFVTGATPTRPVPPPEPDDPPHNVAEPPLKGVRVVDLSIMWAGPLATWLLASLGAEVIKVEPACRPDGLRGSPALFQALNRGKRRADLDLRSPARRRDFLDLVADADVVLDNFSPRVAPNLGIEPAALRARNTRLCSISMPAFPAGSAERDWVAYGTGIHAISGLGDAGEHGFLAPAVTYPDVLAGFGAFAVAAALLAARDGAVPQAPAGGTAASHAEVALRDAVEPLRALHDHGATLRRAIPAPALAGLRASALDEAGLARPPFAGPGLPVALDPAPGWS